MNQHISKLSVLVSVPLFNSKGRGMPNVRNYNFAFALPLFLFFDLCLRAHSFRTRTRSSVFTILPFALRSVEMVVKLRLPRLGPHSPINSSCTRIITGTACGGNLPTLVHFSSRKAVRKDALTVSWSSRWRRPPLPVPCNAVWCWPPLRRVLPDVCLERSRLQHPGCDHLRIAHSPPLSSAVRARVSYYNLR